jgi:DNA-binding GntR family transcriptional regulator
MTIAAPRRMVDSIARPSVADAVFEELHRQILALELPPGAKISEADVAALMGVSRQPVRDAFYRLSMLGFITIRPQRSTTISAISERSVMQARFIRASIEAETVRLACERLTDADIRALESIIAAQDAAVVARDRGRFHELDDLFHREICERTDHGYAWEIIREKKSHMDRVRFLSLSFASRDAFDDHVRVLDAIKARDVERAMAEMRTHLSRICTQIRRIRADNEAYFEGEHFTD